MLLSALITIACLMLFWEYGFGIFSTLFWFKIGTLGLTFYWEHFRLKVCQFVPKCYFVTNNNK